LEAANNALRAAISCKSSSLKAHSSSSSVIHVPAGTSRPRSRHDPVKAFQNHASLLVRVLLSASPCISSPPPPTPSSTDCRMGLHSSFAPVVCWPSACAALGGRPALAAVAACCKFRCATTRHAAFATNSAQQVTCSTLAVALPQLTSSAATCRLPTVGATMSFGLRELRWRSPRGGSIGYRKIESSFGVARL
jgi:hypothetical protein